MNSIAMLMPRCVNLNMSQHPFQKDIRDNSLRILGMSFFQMEVKL